MSQFKIEITYKTAITNIITLFLVSSLVIAEEEMDRESDVPIDIWSSMAFPFSPQNQPKTFTPEIPTYIEKPRLPIIPFALPPQEELVAEYPEEYWNCLLNNLQGLGSDVAAKLITRACQKKYPKR